jgi:hypothetical protein
MADGPREAPKLIWFGIAFWIVAWKWEVITAWIHDVWTYGR